MIKITDYLRLILTLQLVSQPDLLKIKTTKSLQEVLISD